MPHIKGPSGAENAWRKLDCKISEIKISSMKHDAPLLAFLFWEDSFNNANKWCRDCCRCFWKAPSQIRKWGSYIQVLQNRWGCDGTFIYLMVWLSITDLNSVTTLDCSESHTPMLFFKLLQCRGYWVWKTFLQFNLLHKPEIHVNYSVSVEKKWGWAKMNIRRLVSKGWWTQLNHVLLPVFHHVLHISLASLEFYKYCCVVIQDVIGTAPRVHKKILNLDLWPLYPDSTVSTHVNYHLEVHQSIWKFQLFYYIIWAVQSHLQTA